MLAAGLASELEIDIHPYGALVQTALFFDSLAIYLTPDCIRSDRRYLCMVKKPGVSFLRTFHSCGTELVTFFPIYLVDQPIARPIRCRDALFKRKGRYGTGR
jgi:hypothetical protein